MSSDPEEDTVWLLCDLSNQLEDLQVPIKLNPDIKYTAVDVTTSSIWFGSNTGNLYVFNRVTLKHTHLISIQSTSHSQSDVLPIETVRAHLSDTCCAVATKKRVYITQRSGSKLCELIEAASFDDSDVTYLHWHSESSKLYTGLSDGRIIVISVLFSRVLLCRTTTLLKLDSSIVQLDSWDNLLLASTLTKTSLCELESKSVTEVGHKQRNGSYGSVLVACPDDEGYICCARPGYRLWKSDLSGNVLCTYNYKQILLESPGQPILSTRQQMNDAAESQQSSLPSFSVFYKIRDGFLLSYHRGCAYILSTKDAASSMWAQVNQGSVVCSCVCDSTLYLLTSEGRLLGLDFCTLEEFLNTLLEEETIPAAVDLSLKHQDYMKRRPVLLSRIREIFCAANSGPNSEDFDSVFLPAIRAYQEYVLTKPASDSLILTSSPETTTPTVPISCVKPASPSLERENSCKSLASVDSGSQASYMAAKRGSFISLSSLDQSVENGQNLSEEGHGKPSARTRVKAAALSLLRLDRNSGDGIVGSPSNKSTLTRSGSNSSLTSAGASSAAEVSSPTQFVDNMKVQVKGSFSKISNQAINLITTIKEKASQQQVLEKILPHDGADGGSISSKSEESGSQYGFFISDEDVDMAEEMPTSLLAYSEITESTYEKLFPDSDAEVPDSETRRQLLNNWCRKLCSLLAEYTNSHSGERDATDKTLLGFKKYCPWKTSERQSHVSSELALLCVRDSCYESLIPYSVVPLSDLTEPLIGCLIDAGSPDDDEPIVTLTLDSVFLSAFWFLLDENRILDYIEELVVTDINRSRCLWRSLINCLLMSKMMTGDWRNNLKSYTTSELKLKVLENDSRAECVLYTYLLGKLDRISELLGASFSLWSRVPSLYLRFTLELLDSSPQFFSVYLYSVLQFIDKSNRLSYLLGNFHSDDLVDYWMSCLYSLYRESLDGRECDCGKPQVLVKCLKNTTALPMASFDLSVLLEETFPKNKQVQLISFLIGGESAVLRRLTFAERFTNPEREEIFKYLLLSSDVSLVTSLAENRVLTAADWKMIFKLRCRQDGGGEFTRCLWCNADYSGAAVDCSSAATHRLDIRQLIDVMIRSLEAGDSLEVLESLPLGETRITPDVFTACLLENSRRAKTRKVTQKFLYEMENSLAWTHQGDGFNMDPRILHLISREMDISQLQDEELKLKEQYELGATLDTLMEDFELNDAISSSYWGVQFRLGANQLCHVCQQVLLKPHHDDAEGPARLKVDRRGLVYHEDCTK